MLKAHLNLKGGHAVVIIPMPEGIPLIIAHAGREFAKYDPGFAAWGGPRFGAYYDYFEAVPVAV